MRSFIARIVFRLDRLFPRARVGGRESGEAYAAWEHREGTALLDRYGARIGTLAGRRLLDVGCGLGGKSIVYAEAGARVTGIDIERRNIEQAARFAAERGAEASFLVGSVEALPFPADSFDLVVSNDSMEHFRDPGAALREIARVLRPGGRVFLFFTPWGSPLGSHLYDHLRAPWCHLVYPRWLLAELLALEAAQRGAPDPKGEAIRLLGEFDAELNRITVARYRRILRSSRDLAAEFEERRPPKYRRLAPLARAPLVGELFTGTVVGILRKRHSP